MLSPRVGTGLPAPGEAATRCLWRCEGRGTEFPRQRGQVICGEGQPVCVCALRRGFPAVRIRPSVWVHGACVCRWASIHPGPIGLLACPVRSRAGVVSGLRGACWGARPCRPGSGNCRLCSGCTVSLGACLDVDRRGPGLPPDAGQPGAWRVFTVMACDVVHQHRRARRPGLQPREGSRVLLTLVPGSVAACAGDLVR